MLRILAIIGLLATTAACSPSRDFHGYVPDQVSPNTVEPGVDTRSTVLARLGTPSTTSIFDDNTWIYMSTQRTRFAYFKPKTSARSITAIRFGGEADGVVEVLTYGLDDGQVINYASRETPTRGKELGLLEQIFGTVGVARLPDTEAADPNRQP